jgi:hypothetical protein
MTSHPTVYTDFKKYIGTPFQEYILPIIPVSAKLSPNSGISPQMLGKIPGRYHLLEHHWVGFGGWQSNRPTQTQLERWELHQLDTGPTAMGLITGEIVVIDCDSDDAEYVALQRRLAEEHLGITPVVRCRDGAVRVQLFYKRKPRTPFIKKRLTSFRDSDGVKYLTEVLGHGQQTVIEGPHASGKMHYWENGGLIEHANAIPEVTLDETDAYVNAVAEASQAMGLEKIRISLPTASDRAAAVRIDDLMSPHLAKDMALLEKAIKAIDINDTRVVAYDRWLTLFRAMWAACGGNRDFYDTVIWPWLQGNPANTAGEMELKLASFTDSQVGAACVYNWAAKFGFTDGKYEIVREIMANAPIPPALEGGADQGTPGAAQAATGGDNGAGGPTPFPYTDAALADLFASLYSIDHKYTPDEGWVKRKRGVFVPEHCIIHPIRQIRSSVGDPFRSQGPRQIGIDILMKSHKTHARVEQALRSHPDMYASPEEFDAEPWLLNTPEFIVDLRDGSVLPHGMLMRQQTAVSPNLDAIERYYEACPRWMAYLEFIAADRLWVIPFLQRWGGAHFVGAFFDLYFLFIHGKPGTGKTMYIDALSRLAYLYGHAASKGFFMRSLDKRTFELYQTFKKRAVFSDEVPKGSTWDEMLFLAMLSGS